MGGKAIYILIVWLNVALVVAALLFVPYGYNEYKSTTIYRNPQDSTTTTQRVSWKYVGHAFILKIPGNDPALDAIDLQLYKDDKNVLFSSSLPSIRIWWTLVAIEFAVIQSLTIGMVVTVYMVRKSNGVRSKQV